MLWLFSKKTHLETPKGHMESKLYYGSSEVQSTAFCLLNYTTPFILKRSMHFPLPVTVPYLCSKLLLLAAILRQQQDEKIKNEYSNHNNIILHTNIFIEVH